MQGEGITRRGFVGTLGASAGAAAFAASAPAIGRAGVGANDTIRMAIVGAGSRGNQLLDGFYRRDPREFSFVAVADVDDKHAEETASKIAKLEGKTPKTTRDYRTLLDDKDLDVVVIATPDHWHAHPTIHACQAGKDVYCEKPLAHNVAEGQAMLKAARKYDRIVAVGTQQRSSENFRKAVETVKSGKLGRVFWVQTWNYENISPTGMGVWPDSAPPQHLDWDRWLGPAPYRPYNPNRAHLLFRWFSDYAGGMMSDWGVHLNDIVLWALDQKGPKSVCTTGGIYTTRDDRDTPDTMQVVYEFPGDTILTYSMRKGNGLRFNGKDYGILFCGTDGSLLLDRSGHEILPERTVLPYGIKAVHGDKLSARKIDLQAESFKAQNDGLPAHLDDFFACLKSRKRPICDVQVTHRSTNTCHLGNISYWLKRKLQWDAEAETFVNDSEANAYLRRAYRSGYELPEV